MARQEELFYDDEHHALRRVIEEGGGYKKTAAHLFPDMKAESAYSKLKHAVNGTNGEVLRFGQVRVGKFRRELQSGVRRFFGPIETVRRHVTSEPVYI